MVSQKYRWDFIGLSTDEKPTSETSDKVVNGSTYYCSDTSKLYVYCDGTWYERKPLGGGGTSDFNDLPNRPKYNGSDMTGSTNIPEVVTYSNFTGTDGTTAGTAGLVPAPATTDAGKFLKADGTWDTAGGGGGPTVVQTTGTSQADVMSQNAVTSMVFADPGTRGAVRIGNTKNVYAGSVGIGRITGSQYTGASGNFSVAIGSDASADANGAVSIGKGADIRSIAKGAIALGTYSKATSDGEMNIGSSDTSYGYNNSNYRLLTGLYDPQSAHDAATKGYVDPTTDSSAPTTATVGRLGQIQIDTTNNDAYMCVAVDDVTPTYTWKKITV